MRRTIAVLFIALALTVPAGAQPRQGEMRSPVVAPGDEIKLDEQAALRASAIQSRMSAILANFALLQRQAQDLQQEMTKSLEDRRRLLDEAARKARVDLREPNDWVFDESGQRYIRSKKTP